MKEARSFKHTNFKASLKAACLGLKACFCLERNFRFQCLCAGLMILLAFVLQLALLEWCIIILCICLVLVIELINTALETALDALHPHYHELVGRAKDLAAGAVLVISCASGIIGLLIVIHALLERFTL